MERFYLYPTHMIFRDLYTAEYEAPSHFYISMDWPFLSCDTESVHVSEPGREERGGKKRN